MYQIFLKLVGTSCIEKKMSLTVCSRLSVLIACRTIAFPTKVKRLRKYKSIPVGIIIAAGIRPAELAADGEEEEEEDQQPLLSSNNCVSVADDLLFSRSSDSLLVHISDGFG